MARLWIPLAVGLETLTLAACQCGEERSPKPAAPTPARTVGAVSLPASAPRPVPTACPPSTVFIPARSVCIQRWEAQLVHADGRLHDPYAVPPHPSAMAGMYARSSPGVVPQGYVGREQAEIACAGTVAQEYRFRLCTVSEWEAACRGPNQEFPQQQEALVARCNTGKFPDDEHLVYRFFPSPRWNYRELTDPRLNQVPGGLARTGDYGRCTNGYGVFDMVGNLQEWTADLRPKNGRTMSVLKGDHYQGQGKNYVGCAATNGAHYYLPPTAPDYRIDRDWKDYSTGFRCCADPR